MTNYKANSLDSRNFTIYQDDNVIGELTYPKWFTFNALIKSPSQGEFKFESKGFWKSTVELKDGDSVLAQVQMGWKGIVIKLNPGNDEQTYLLKSSGFMKYGFTMLTSDNEKILEATARFKISKFQFEYDFEATEEFEQLENKDVLLLTSLHCINYYLKMIVMS